MIAIKHRFTNTTLCEFDAETVRQATELAVKNDANLYGANLYGANLYGADLRGANLRGANLRGADLRGANLYGADLRDADLYGADLRDADLRDADLYGANLGGANLGGANLGGANLRGADLYGADLRGADLYGADLRDANLCGADLGNVKNSELALAQTSIVPEEGAFVGYKKLANGVIAKLVIPHDSKRLNAYGSRKCRAEKVFVLEGSGVSQHDQKTTYAPETWVIPDSFNEDRREECSNGIHFFITRIEAENY